jgi:hypothetical protein
MQYCLYYGTDFVVLSTVSTVILVLKIIFQRKIRIWRRYSQRKEGIEGDLSSGKIKNLKCFV